MVRMSLRQSPLYEQNIRNEPQRYGVDWIGEEVQRREEEMRGRAGRERAAR